MKILKIILNGSTIPGFIEYGQRFNVKTSETTAGGAGFFWPEQEGTA